MIKEIEPFERPFGPTDDAVFQALCGGLVGKPLARWRETYADGLVLDFGRLVPREPRKPGLPKERGEWVLSTWGCDVRLISPHAAEPLEDLQEIAAELASLVGQKVSRVSVAADDVSLNVEFENGIVLILQTDRSEAELDQWFILLPGGGSVGATGRSTWYFRTN